MRQNSKTSTNIRKLKPLYIRHGVKNSLHFCQNVNVNAASISTAAHDTGLPAVQIPPFQVFFIITHVNLLRNKCVRLEIHVKQQSTCLNLCQAVAFVFLFPGRIILNNP